MATYGETTLVCSVMTMLHERREADKRRKDDALQFYGDCVAAAEGASSGDAVALLAAMDELGLDSSDLADDSRVVRDVRRIEEQIAALEDQHHAARVARAAAEAELRTAQQAIHLKEPLNRAHDWVAEAECALLEVEREQRSLHQRVLATVCAAPRVFRGQGRRLALALKHPVARQPDAYAWMTDAPQDSQAAGTDAAVEQNAISPA